MKCILADVKHLSVNMSNKLTQKRNIYQDSKTLRYSFRTVARSLVLSQNIEFEILLDKNSSLKKKTFQVN